MTDTRYALRDDETEVRLAQWRMMDGFFVGDWTYEDLFEDPDAVPSPRLEIALQGLEVLTDLAAYRDEEDDSYSVDDAVIEVLDSKGAVLGGYSLAWAVLDIDPRKVATLWGNDSLAPHRGSRVVWEQWRSELPREKGLWARLPSGEREGWVEAAREHYFHEAHLQLRRSWPMPEGDIVLDGRHVTDLASLFCALGEAFNGPGGYFGGNFTALHDCLANLDRRKEQRVTMVWEDIATAEHALAHAPGYEDNWGFFDMAVDTLTRHDIDIVRA